MVPLFKTRHWWVQRPSQWLHLAESFTQKSIFKLCLCIKIKSKAKSCYLSSGENVASAWEGAPQVCDRDFLHFLWRSLCPQGKHCSSGLFSPGLFLLKNTFLHSQGKHRDPGWFSLYNRLEGSLIHSGDHWCDRETTPSSFEAEKGRSVLTSPLG